MVCFIPTSQDVFVQGDTNIQLECHVVLPHRLPEELLDLGAVCTAQDRKYFFCRFVWTLPSTFVYPSQQNGIQLYF